MILTTWNVYRNPQRERAALIDFRDQELRCLVASAYGQVPFYRNWFDAAGVLPGDIRRAEDLVALPLLSKSDLKNAPLESRLARGSDPAKLVFHNTSGSTGEPFTIYRRHAEEDLLQLFRVRAARQYGMRFRDRRVDLTASQSGGPKGPLRHAAKTLRLAQVESLDITRDTSDLLREVARSKPDVLTGYPAVLLNIAREAASCREFLIRPRIVIAGGEPMDALMRSRIKHEFKAPVYDMYGTSEFNLLAWQCPESKHFHICDDNVIVEILSDGEPVEEGEQGEVVVTGLFSRTMPFIRYRTGDLAIKGAEVCGCGQPFSTLGAIQGRTVDYLRLPDRLLVHPFAVLTGFAEWGDSWIDQLQLVQTALDRVVLRVKLRRPATPDELDRVISAGEKACRPARFELEFVDHLELDPSGKFRSYLGLDDVRRLKHARSSRPESAQTRVVPTTTGKK